MASPTLDPTSTLASHVILTLGDLIFISDIFSTGQDGPAHLRVAVLFSSSIRLLRQPRFLFSMEAQLRTRVPIGQATVSVAHRHFDSVNEIRSCGGELLPSSHLIDLLLSLVSRALPL